MSQEERHEFMAQKKSERDAAMEEVNAILTDEQKEILLSKKNEMESKGGRGRGAGSNMRRFGGRR